MSSSSQSSSQKMGCLILSFNHPDLTAKTLQSALLHFQGPITLLHNGSEEKHQKRLIAEFPQVEHLILKENRGYSGGVNYGLQALFQKHSWVFLLTNDCELTQFSFSADEKPGLASPLIYFRSKKKVDSLGGSFTPSCGGLSHCRSEEDFKKATHPYIPGTAFFIHRDVFEKVSGFDERLGTYWEDVDFSMQASKLGLRLFLNPQTEIIHGVGKTCHKHRHYTTYLFQRNRKWISRRYTPWHLRLQLELHLWSHWIQLSFRLFNQGRQQDCHLLWKAITESLGRRRDRFPRCHHYNQNTQQNDPKR